MLKSAWFFYYWFLFRSLEACAKPCSHEIICSIQGIAISPYGQSECLLTLSAFGAPVYSPFFNGESFVSGIWDAVEDDLVRPQKVMPAIRHDQYRLSYSLRVSDCAGRR